MSQPTILAVVHQQTSTPGHLGHLLQQQGYRLDLRCPALGQSLPQGLDPYAGVVVFGGPMSANDDGTLPFIRTELDWIEQVLTLEKPFLGICLGAQLLARVLGATVQPHPEGRVEVGYWPLAVAESVASPVAADPVPAAVQPPMQGVNPLAGLEVVFQWHNEGFELPQGAQRLAATENFPTQAFVYGASGVAATPVPPMALGSGSFRSPETPAENLSPTPAPTPADRPLAYGLQFHPEITLAIMEFWNQEGVAMLDRPGAQPTADQFRDYYRHQGEIHRWLDRFVAHWLRSTPQASYPAVPSALSIGSPRTDVSGGSDRARSWDAAH
ncbi:MAG: glutamine amidotransferase-related protein [Prochlorothrix sp.]